MICTQATASRSSRLTKSELAMAVRNWSKSELNQRVCEASIQSLSMTPFSTASLALDLPVVSSQSSSSMTSAPSEPCSEYTTLRTPAVQVRKVCAYPLGKVSTALRLSSVSQCESRVSAFAVTWVGNAPSQAKVR